MNIEILNFLDSLIKKMEVVSSGLARIIITGFDRLYCHVNMKKLMTKTSKASNHWLFSNLVFQ